MSRTFRLVCETTKKKVWVGQGYPRMDSFYSGEPATMHRLAAFLKEHENMPLKLLCDDTHGHLVDYEEFQEGSKAPSPLLRAWRRPDNNFDKALEALKRGIDPRWTIHGDECGSRGPTPYDGEPSDNGCDCWVAHRRQLIKELEEVAT